MSSAVWLWGEYHCLSFVSTRHCTVIFQKVSFLGLRQLLHKHSLTSILMSIWGRPVHSPGSLIRLSLDFCSVDSSFLAVQLTFGFTSTIQDLASDPHSWCAAWTLSESSKLGQWQGSFCFSRLMGCCPLLSGLQCLKNWLFHVCYLFHLEGGFWGVGEISGKLVTLYHSIFARS